MLAYQNNKIKILIVLIFLFICNITSSQNPYKNLYNIYKNELVDLTNIDPEFKIVRIVKCYEVIEIKLDSIKIEKGNSN